MRCPQLEPVASITTAIFEIPKCLFFEMARRYNLRRSTRSRQLRHHQPTGAPQDPTPRIKLNIDDLDLDKSYVKPSVANSQSGRSKKHRPWRRRVEKEPLTDSAKLPKGWHMNEDDLAIE